MSKFNQNLEISSPPLRLGVIGTGRISQIVLPQLPAWQVVVAGLADVQVTAAHALAEKLGHGQVYESPAALLACPEIEAVYLATPPVTHRDLVKEALAAGKHVLCEKPWTLNAAEARALLETVQQFPALKVGCCSSRFCYSPATASAREVLRQGTLGKLIRVRLHATGGLPASIDHLPEWKRNAATAGGGLTVDWCVYELEWLRSVLGDAFAPLDVMANFGFWRREGTSLESSYYAVIRCAGGLEIVVSRQPEIGPRRHAIELRGETGGLDLPFAPDHPQRVARLFTLEADGKTLNSAERGEPTTDWGGILYGPLTDLADAIRNDTAPSATAEGQITVHAVLDAIYTSAREHRVVPVAL
ncbi:MAG: Gfo/Idh/MocA family oxidoreductase [Opitutus sp.]|nr:Gfo/Idh/MocA family oxidoreductase [Opitutus sp.]MCS6247327.1 Gfo/Idh/MocA family oxidoreductase [Opitutus sp.]MCS6275279.1 Gfo/Idh/MocA family oxidoreductase [Opitutus sp.]MCS6277567.1 Gfo/Idh/MocA family oxidoreductase [Opitutus sp.]MCS6300685.1 Gfo/Idh/MocA family oxidoreductase [Opitutus sp.]